MDDETNVDNVTDDQHPMPPDDESEDEVDILHSVKMFQTEHNRNTCLKHQNLEEAVVENFSKEVVNKRKSIKSSKSFAIAPGEGKIPTNWLREEHFDVKGFPTLPSNPTSLYKRSEYIVPHRRSTQVNKIPS